MEMGGNKRFRNFLNNYTIENEPIKQKYQTEAAFYYRTMLQNLVDGNPSDPPPEVEAGKVLRIKERDFQDNYGGSGGGEPEGEEDFEAKAKKVFTGIGGFFKKAYNTTAAKTKEMSAKVAATEFGQKTAAGFGVVADKTKQGFNYTVEKSKVAGGFVAEKSKVAYVSIPLLHVIVPRGLSLRVIL